MLGVSIQESCSLDLKTRSSMSWIWNRDPKTKMPGVLSAHSRNFLPFPRGCRLSCLVWAFPISQYCDKRKIVKEKNQPKISLMKTLAFNQLHDCRVQMRSSHGRSRSLRVVPAARELTFTREGSPGIVRNNHVTEVCAALKGTGTCSPFPGKFPSGHVILRWT